MPPQHPYLLIAMDIEADIELARRVLDDNGFDSSSYVLARSGVEALDYLFACGSHSGRQGIELPAGVLVGLASPGLTSTEMLSEIRANSVTRPLPVVVFTSSDDGHDLHEAHLAGATSCIPKPPDNELFASTLRQVIRYWLRLNVAPRIWL